MLVAAVRLDRGGVGGGGGRVAGGLPETSIWNVEMQGTASLSAEFEEDRRAKGGGVGGALWPRDREQDPKEARRRGERVAWPGCAGAVRAPLVSASARA